MYIVQFTGFTSQNLPLLPDCSLPCHSFFNIMSSRNVPGPMGTQQRCALWNSRSFFQYWDSGQGSRGKITVLRSGPYSQPPWCTGPTVQIFTSCFQAGAGCPENIFVDVGRLKVRPDYLITRTFPRCLAGTVRNRVISEQTANRRTITILFHFPLSESIANVNCSYSAGHSASHISRVARNVWIPARHNLCNFVHNFPRTFRRICRHEGFEAL